VQEQTPEGLIVPGKFFQIELMVKGAEQHKATEGWGWARWRGLDLKPYGKDAAFVTECTGCRLPLRGNDYVYTLPFSPAVVSGQEVVNNTAARFPKGLSFNPLDWTPITVYADPRTHAIAVLFARDGAEKALVTWTTRDDPHWFGARIPDKVLSVETLRSSQVPAERSRFIANLRPVQIP
jgi:hypothetical protein